MLPTSNFGFLSAHDAQLVQLGALAERYFRDDPATTIFELRQFAELLCNRIAAHHALYLGDRETFEDTLRRLSFERIIPKEAADVFHALRKAGNSAVHEVRGSHSDALSALKFARQIGIWFHRTYGKQRDFKAGPFIPPPEPVDATINLKEEIARLSGRLAESFAGLLMISPTFRNYLQTAKSATTSACAIYQRSLMAAPFAFPPLDEQRSIVHRTHATISLIDRLASEATSARKLIDHLDRGILAKAFRGELVPQDPNDEPAGALLERICSQGVQRRTARRSGSAR